MENQQQELKAHLRVKVELLDHQHFTSKDERKRQSTQCKTVMTLPDGKRSAVEFWLDGHQHFAGSDWVADIRVGADYKGRFEARVLRLSPPQPPKTS